jgi:hypothetical protein
MAGAIDDAIAKFRVASGDVARLYLGIAFYMKREWPEALEVLSPLVARAWPAAFYAGLCEQQLGRLPEAAALFAIALASHSLPEGLGPESHDDLVMWRSVLVASAKALEVTKQSLAGGSHVDVHGR